MKKFIIRHLMVIGGFAILVVSFSIEAAYILITGSSLPLWTAPIVSMPPTIVLAFIKDKQLITYNS